MQEAAEVLSRLIRFNTVNPPGAERECQEWLRGHLPRRASRSSCWPPTPSGRTWSRA